MPEIPDAHYALVLREVARFARIHNAALTAPTSGSATFQLTSLSTPGWTTSYMANFERLTGGSNAEWQSPSFVKLSAHLPDIVGTLKKERGLVRTVDTRRWKWHQFRWREEALMWAGLLRLRVVRERWMDRAWGELVLIEEPGRSFAAPLLVGEQAHVIQEFLRFFSSLKAEVSLGNVLGVPPPSGLPSALSATDEWSLARSCDVTVKVLGETPVEQAASVDEVMDDD